MGKEIHGAIVPPLFTGQYPRLSTPATKTMLHGYSLGKIESNLVACFFTFLNYMRKDFFYTPNQIPVKERLQNAVFSILLFSYGSYGVYVNDLYIPGKRSKGIHLHDVPAWIMYGAMICACAVMLSVVVDHYDKRNNETNYKSFANTFKFLGWGFFVLSLVMAIIR